MMFIVLWFCALICGVPMSWASELGDTCTLERTGATGTCAKIANCDIVRRNIRTQGFTRCDFGADGSLVVCCPNPPTTTTERPRRMTDRISARKCTEYMDAIYETVEIGSSRGRPITQRQNKCSILMLPFVVNGNETAPKEFPHMALLGYQSNPSKPISFECAGSLISENFVLSAAHCITSKSFNGDVKYVRLGEYILDTRDDDDNPIEFRVVESIVHKSYDETRKYHDIALLRLDRNVPFSQYMRPACLAETAADAEVSRALATGWGATKFQHAGSKVLMKVGLETFANSECNDIYSKPKLPRVLSRGIVAEEQLCAGSHTEAKDTCQGDSGGPLQIYHPEHACMYMVLGVTSFGARCVGRIPSIYTRVDHYLDWIEQHVWAAA